MTMEETYQKLSMARTYIENFKVTLEGILEENNRRKMELIEWGNDWLIECDKIKVDYTLNNIYKSLLTIYLSKYPPEFQESITYMETNLNLNNTKNTFLSLCSLYSKTMNDFKKMNIKDISKINKSFKAQLSVLMEDLDPLAVKLFYNYFAFSSPKFNTYSDSCGNVYRGSGNRC